MRTFKHWNVTYVMDRLAQFLWQRANPDSPWVTHQMADILNDFILPTDYGLEFGSGRSTIWFASRVAHLTSVEHNESWFNIVRSKMGQECSNVDLYLRTELAANGGPKSYLEPLAGIQDESLDFVLIDGVLRDYCASSSISKLKNGGMLIIDNVERYLPRANKSSSPAARNMDDGYASVIWQSVAEQINDWRCIWTSDGVSDTALWIKT